jgi:hypothetical protein
MEETMKRIGGILARGALAAAALALVAAPAFRPAEAGKCKKKSCPYTDEFPIGDCSALVTSTADGAHNPYVPLEIGRIWNLSNQECFDAGGCDELEEVTITVLDETETVDGVLTRVVEEREWEDGNLDEVARNFYVECLDTGDVYYYGEDVEDGSGNPLPDGWRAGVNGATPGLIFPGGAFLLGARYFQEVAPGVALDRAENVAMGLDVSVPAGDFSDCVLVHDTDALEDPKGKHPDPKIYCRGLGFATDEELVLTSYVDP